MCPCATNATLLVGRGNVISSSLSNCDRQRSAAAWNSSCFLAAEYATPTLMNARLGVSRSLYLRLVGKRLGITPNSDFLHRGSTSRPQSPRLQPRGALKVCCFTQASGLMATSASDQEFEQAMDALGTLISGRSRGDGKSWETAYDYMQVYLEVSKASWSNSVAMEWIIFVNHR